MTSFILAALLCLSPHSNPTQAVATPGSPPASGAIALPESAAPRAELAPLGFLVGTWVGVNPNGTLNEEVWTAPRGNHMVGMFHQVRKDGKPAFVEVSLITVETEGVRLRLRHLHGGLEVPEQQKETWDLFLQEARDNRAVFTGKGRGGVETTVTYRISAPDELTMETSFAGDGADKGYTLVYRRG